MLRMDCSDLSTIHIDDATMDLSLAILGTMQTLWVVPKMVVPQNGWFTLESPMKWMIWGYPYFWKHPYRTFLLGEQRFSEEHWRVEEGRWGNARPVKKRRSSAHPIRMQHVLAWDKIDTHKNWMDPSSWEGVSIFNCYQWWWKMKKYSIFANSAVWILRDVVMLYLHSLSSIQHPCM